MMTRIFLFLFIITLSPLFGSAQNEPSIKNKSIVKAKMAAARHEYLENNMRGALTLYRQILQLDESNAKAKYRSAQCHYALKRYDLALKYLTEAVEIDAEVDSDVQYYYGLSFQKMAKLNDAIVAFSNFTASFPKRAEDLFVEVNIAQCKYAKMMMEKPLNVSIVNLGSDINSRFDDYAPSVTADGKTLVFTSRRQDTKGGSIDDEGDYKFFEDIYFSEKKEGVWQRAEGIPGEVNTESYDAVLSINPQGTAMYIYKNNETSAGDIFVSYKAENGNWPAPEKLPKPINTSYFEGSTSISKDGNTMYFISERKRGYGNGDIYFSTKNKMGTWSTPENIGDVINTPEDEKFVFIHPDGKTLYFSSEGHLTLGSYDIFKSENINGVWTKPINLGYPINTVKEESTFSITEDNKTLYIAAEYKDSFGERDIYKIDISNQSFSQPK